MRVAITATTTTTTTTIAAIIITKMDIMHMAAMMDITLIMGIIPIAGIVPTMGTIHMANSTTTTKPLVHLVTLLHRPQAFLLL